MTGPEKKNPTPTRGVPITLDKERRLRFSLRTMRELSEEFGEDALEVGVPVNSMAKFLWYGLKHEDPDLKIEDVEDMVDLEHLDDVMKAVFLATGRRAEKVPGPQMPAPQIPRPAVAGSEKKPSVSQSVSPSVIPESAQTERA